jgi:hypothetical protein
MNRARLAAPALALCACLALTACAGLAENSGRILDGSAFAEKVLETWRAASTPEGGLVLRRVRYRDKTEGFTLGADGWPTLKLHLDVTEDDARSGTESGALTVYPVSCAFLASTLFGWNEWSMELSGTGSLVTDGESRALSLERVETVDISAGAIRRGDTRLGGADARSALKNRRERIDALAAYIREKAAERFPGKAPREIWPDEKTFEAYWKPLLLPETVFSPKRPGEYDTRGAVWAGAEDIQWNTSYSAAAFPEDIAALRNSGALLRDWEEALPWIRLAVNWDEIIAAFSVKTRFTRAAK